MNTPLAAVALPVDAAAERLRVRRTWFGFLAMSIGVFMAFLDIQIVASSLNQIQAGLSATPQEIGWVQSAYLIAEVIAIPLSGYLSRLLSTRVYFTISVLGFTASSVACAAAWNIESMMVFRAIQGFLGGGMIPTSFAALYPMFPPEKRIVPQVLAGLIATSAPTLGPILGGYVTDLLSWHWLFLINVVPGLLSAAVVWSLVDIDRPDHSLWRRIDLQGVISMALFLGALEWVLEEGPGHNWFSNGSIIFWSLLATGSAFWFFSRVFTIDNPIVDLSAFRNRQFACGNFAAMMMTVPLFAGNFILPLFLGQLRGFNSVQIGDTLMISGVSMFLVAPFASRLVRTFDIRVIFACSSAMVAFGSWKMAHLTPETGWQELMIPLGFRGAGFMLSMVCCSAMSLSTLPLDQIKNGSGMYSLMRNLGGALGLASLNTLIFWRTAVHEQHFVEALTPSRAPVREFMTDLGSTMIGSHDRALMMVQLARRVQLQVSVMTYNDVLIVLTWVACLTIPIFFLVERPVLTRAAPPSE